MLTTTPGFTIVKYLDDRAYIVSHADVLCCLTSESKSKDCKKLRIIKKISTED